MEYPTIFNLIALISLFVLGFRTITNKDRIGYFLRKPFEIPEKKKKIRKYIILKWIGKPLITCAGCMPSVHGTLIFFASSYIDPMPLYYWPLVVIPSCFVCAIMWEIMIYFNPNDYN